MGLFDRTNIITLTTDFGCDDYYVGAMHGAILIENPKARIVDISHGIPSFDIEHGAYILGTSYQAFPRGSIHVGVVDPGVGSERLPILIETDDYFFVGPDNGLFTLAMQKENVRAIYQIANRSYFRPEMSATFHGRDIFAPVAAHLALGIAPSRFGPREKSIEDLPFFDVESGRGWIKTRIIAIDKFGNAVTNLSRQLFDKKVGPHSFTVTIGKRRLSHLSNTYADVPVGKPLMLFGSSGFLELSCNQGSMAATWKLRVGQRVTLKIA